MTVSQGSRRRDGEVRVQYFNGAGYVVRKVTRYTVMVGTRQGMARPSGFAIRSYVAGQRI